MSVNDLPDDQNARESHTAIAVGQPLATDHGTPEPQRAPVGGHLLSVDQNIIGAQAPLVVADTSAADQTCCAHQTVSVGGTPLSDDQSVDDPHTRYVVADTSAADHVRRDTQRAFVGGNFSSQPPTIAAPSPIPRSSDGWLELRIWAEMFNDAQLARIAAVNRAERGGVDPVLYSVYTDALVHAEHVCGLEMRRCYKRVVPTAIRQWATTSKGVGDHLVARLLGHLGDPAIATPHHWEGTGTNRVLVGDDPHERTLAQLWQYCGHGDAARRIRKGMTADDLAALGQPKLKMLVHLLAEACMKQKPGNTYRDVYEARRLVTAGREHTTPCVRCGPSGKPAAAGTPWSKGHQHADALRIVGKELLRDLWLVAREQQMAVAA